MSKQRRGTWVNFESRDPKAATVRFSVSCISTSSESAAQFTTVRSTGKISGINDKVKDLPQTVREGSARGRA